MASIFNFQSTFPSSREGYLEAFIVERVDLGLAPIGFSANRSAVSAILFIENTIHQNNGASASAS